MEKKIKLFSLLFFCAYIIPHKIDIQRCFWANYQHFNGNKKLADVWFSRLFSSKVPQVCYVSYIHFLFEAKRFSEIYALKNMILTEFKSDISLHLLLADVLAMYGEDHTIYDTLIDLNAKYPTHPELALYMVQIFSAKKEFEKAISCIDTLLNKSTRLPNTFLFHFTKAQLHLQTNNFAEALISAECSIELFPYFDKTWLMLGLLYEQMGDIEQAIMSYKKFISMSLNPLKEFEQRIALLLLQQNVLLAVAEKDVESKHAILQAAKNLYEKKLYHEALRHINVLKKTDNSFDVVCLKVDILCAQKRYKAAIQEIQQHIKDDIYKPKYIEKLHIIALEHNCTREVITLFKKYAEEKTESITLLYLADLFLRLNEYNAAIRYLEQAKSNTVDCTEHNIICFQLALLYQEKQDMKKMKTVLEDALAKDNQCDYIMNVLAYYHAKHKKDFEKAHALITKALTVSPQNPHYLDTQAFIFYKQGFFDKAEIMLKNIFDTMKHDPFIILHYAKVLMKQKKYSATENLLQNITTTTFPEFFTEKAKKIQNKIVLNTKPID